MGSKENAKGPQNQSISDGTADGEKQTRNNPLWSFCTSHVTIAVTLVRIAALIPQEQLPLSLQRQPLSESSSIIGWLLHDPNLAPFWTSILIRPYETWHHIREAQAVRTLFASNTGESLLFRNAYRGSYIHVPPLVLAALESMLEYVCPTNPHMQSFVLGVLLHLVDLGIAIKIVQLGTHVLLSNAKLANVWEDHWLPILPAPIRPPKAHIFALAEKEVEYTDEIPIKKLPETAENEKEEKGEEVAENEKTEEWEDIPADDNNDDRIQETIEEEPLYSTASPLFALSDLPLFAARFYYYSPFTALATGIGSTHQCFQNLWLFFLLSSLEEGCRQSSSISLSAFWLALASYVEVHYIVFLIPLALWLERRHSAATRMQSNQATGNTDGRNKQIYSKYLGTGLSWTEMVS